MHQAAIGFDKMENVLLYHLNAMTYGLQDWFPQMSPEQRAFFRKVHGLVCGFSF